MRQRVRIFSTPSSTPLTQHHEWCLLYCCQRLLVSCCLPYAWWRTLGRNTVLRTYCVFLLRYSVVDVLMLVLDRLYVQPHAKLTYVWSLVGILHSGFRLFLGLRHFCSMPWLQSRNCRDVVIVAAALAFVCLCSAMYAAPKQHTASLQL